MRKAIFPGSFDPVTKGHHDIIIRALPLFDELTIAIGINAEKKYLFPIEQREKWLNQVFAAYPKIKVTKYKGLTVDYCKEIGADFIVRGIRTSADFEFEKGIAQMNRALSGIETVFIISDPSLSAISSSIVRDIYKNGGDISTFLPEGLEI